MSTIFDLSAQMYVYISRYATGYGITPQDAKAMADAAEAAQAERARRAAVRVPKYRYNEKTARYEIVEQSA